FRVQYRRHGQRDFHRQPARLDLGAHGFPGVTDRRTRAPPLRFLGPVMHFRFLAAAFWIVLAGFFAWDWTHSAPVNVRTEPPLIAAGSGVAPSGGHCASTF